MPRELVIISGKGGTGKTSVTAAVAVLAGKAVMADCDVDAADLHLVLAPQVRERHEFRSGHEAVIHPDACTGCGACASLCRYAAAVPHSNEGGRTVYTIDPVSCEGCGVCVRFCPAHAIDFPEQRCGEWMVSTTRCGPMVHARLAAAAENSGKLVTAVRREARRIAAEENRPLIIVDGPPGIGCPVIASLGCASLVLVVTEPTVSGIHDLRRVLSLARHFKVPAAVCVNKWDLNPAMAAGIETEARACAAPPAGRIPYDPSVTAAQMAGTSVVELGGGEAAQAIGRLWNTVNGILSRNGTTG